jgi:hypothetical protein
VKVYINGVFKSDVSKGVMSYIATGLTPDTVYEIGTHTVDTTGNVNQTWKNDTERTSKLQDKTPPGTVVNLHMTSIGTDYIEWGWSNPSDSDFNHVDIYMNGVLKDDNLKGTNIYRATGLSPGTTYTIGIRTVDNNGNIGTTLKTNIQTTASNIIRFATIGDPHLGETPDGTANLIAAANFLKGRKDTLDFVVEVGDYHTLSSAQSILGVIGKPLYFAKGNHDGLSACGGSSGDSVTNVGGYQLIIVGICGASPGQSVLTKSYSKTVQTVVFTHLPSGCTASLPTTDPYYRTGCGFVDTLGISASKLLGVYSGHVHKYTNQNIGNVLYVTEDNLGGNGAATDYIGYIVIQDGVVSYSRLYYK